MRVLYVNHTAQPSGAGISLSTLLRHLPPEIEKFFLIPKASEIDAMLGAAPERTFRERFLCQFMTTRYVSRYPPHLLAWHLAKIPIALRRISQLVRRWKIDLVHANETSLLTYVFAASFFGVPSVLHARTAIAPRAFERWLISRLSRTSQVRIAAIDSEVQKSLPESVQHRSEIIYDPIELGPAPSEFEVARLRELWHIKASTVVIGQIASLHRQKGIWLILNLAEKLCSQFPDVRFVLIGDNAASGGEGPRFREAIEARNLGSKVILPGYDSRLSLVYGAIDIGLCMFGEHLGGVGRGAHEAALAGKPLVATLPDPGQTQTFQHGVGGYAFSPEDQIGIERALRCLIESPPLRKKLGEQGRASIGFRHQPENIANQILGLYSDLCPGSKCLARGIKEN